MKPSKFTKNFIYSTFVLLTASGICWLIGHYFLVINGEFGPEMSGLEIWSLRLHGFLAIFGVLSLGLLLESHIKVFIIKKKHIKSGISLSILFVWLIVSGFLLFYLIDEKLHEIISVSHWLSIFAIIPLFYIHITKLK